MSGHSKWSTIKRQKAAKDAKRGNAWARITRDIMVAAREGGDPGANPHLALAVDKAKTENMPRDNIERAIKRGTGEIEGADYVETSYEGYAPGGVAVFIETLTDNTNRTVADIRTLFNKAGGSLGQNGSVAYLFQRKGVFVILAAGREEADLFDLAVDGGAEDLSLEGEHFVITAPVETFGAIQGALEQAAVSAEEASLQRIPVTTTKIAPADVARVVDLIEKLEELQDVQAVFTTLEIDDALVASLS